jgi:hypothetical protein
VHWYYNWTLLCLACPFVPKPYHWSHSSWGQNDWIIVASIGRRFYHPHIKLPIINAAATHFILPSVSFHLLFKGFAGLPATPAIQSDYAISIAFVSCPNPPEPASTYYRPVKPSVCAILHCSASAVIKLLSKQNCFKNQKDWEPFYCCIISLMYYVAMFSSILWILL